MAVALVASGAAPKDTKLAMMGDIATINDIHSAYIHGSIPTAKGESDDIMNMNFPDEVRAVVDCRQAAGGRESVGCAGCRVPGPEVGSLEICDGLEAGDGNAQTTLPWWLARRGIANPDLKLGWLDGCLRP